MSIIASDIHAPWMAVLAISRTGRGEIWGADHGACGKKQNVREGVALPLGEKSVID